MASQQGRYFRPQALGISHDRRTAKEAPCKAAVRMVTQ
jgi:hypothetical protein